MSKQPSPGPRVDESESLYRGITNPNHWAVDEETPEGRPSTSLLGNPNFSVDIASIAESPGYTRDHLQKDCMPPKLGVGVMEFSCADSVAEGYVPRQEIDPDHPENKAHANVYNDGGGSQRKRRARNLIKKCCVRIRPNIEQLQNGTT